jgi:hypothetical protein
VQALIVTCEQGYFWFSKIKKWVKVERKIFKGDKKNYFGVTNL